MVYLLNSIYSYNQPDSWLCGGVLISTTQVLTAAACLTDVSHIYVIAGYNKYVNGNHILRDKCTRTKKRQIVKTIIPKAYTPAIWIKFDVGIGIVGKPYDFSDVSYRTVCSYEPGAIMINYDIKYEIVNSSAIVLGWGGTKARQPGSTNDINSEYLMEARTVLTNVSFCQKHFTQSVEYYSLCTYGSGNVRSNGEVPGELPPDDCDRRRYDLNETECFEEGEMPLRRNANLSDPSLNGIDHQNKIKENNILDRNHTLSRRHETDETFNAGICQNDHGGPLISLIGESEMVIGIALNSVYDYNYQCEGPFLFLSTARSSVLIKCLLSHQNNETRKICESIHNEIKESDVLWPTQSIGDENKGIQQALIEQSRKQVVRIRPQLLLRPETND